MTGPLKIKNTQGPNQKYEAQCHLCRWAYFKWTVEEAREILLWHLDRTHINPPDPYAFLGSDEKPGPGWLDKMLARDNSPLYYWRDC